MTDVINRGLTWLDGKNQSYRTREMTYSRDEETVTVNAMRGRADFGGDQADSAYIGWDFLVRPSEIVISSATVLPSPGDRITEVTDDGTFIYEVMSPAGFACFEYIDGNRRLRIHTKLVG
jgi:hypothetical protein